LPQSGLACAGFTIFAANSETCSKSRKPQEIYLGNSAAGVGWGSGCHPSTRLCLDFLVKRDVLPANFSLLDMGCGSGILGIAGVIQGATDLTLVDVEAEALMAAKENFSLNFGKSTSETSLKFMHVREIAPFDLKPVDVAISNILVGQLDRPSMVANLVTNLKDDGLICLSGIRPGEQCTTLVNAYAKWIKWDDELYLEEASR